MNNDPSTHGTNGKDASGRFARGNKLGRGNPLAGRAAKIRAVLLAKLTPAAVGEIADKLIAQAKTGDIAAIRELLDRTIGKPAQPGVQRLDINLGEKPLQVVKTLIDVETDKL
ncbi:MAG TPA: hypothetical protein VIL86_03245 [Tepidisphaeraceae bacterium]|jgi:hypothetical protein